MEQFKYTAQIFMDKEVVAEEKGNDAEALENWMLAKAQGTFGDVHGEITDNDSKEVIKKFRKSPPD